MYMFYGATSESVISSPLMDVPRPQPNFNHLQSAEELAILEMIDQLQQQLDRIEARYGYC